MNRRLTTVLAVICLALPAWGAVGAGTGGARTLFVGGTDQYSIAFKTEAGNRYVIQLAGSARCHFNEPFEDLGLTTFSMFPAPGLMHERRGEWFAESTLYQQFGSGSGNVRALFDDGEVTGTYLYEYSEESEHCGTRRRLPFEARRYVPAGSPEAASPVPHLAKPYYGMTGPLEIFLDVRGDSVAGVRGTFASRCRIGRHRGGQTRSLFATPTVFDREHDGRFSGHKEAAGRLDSGARFRERFGLSGQVERDRIVGSYRRVRTVLRGNRVVERCVTGPLPFAARHYLPAKR